MCDASFEITKIVVYGLTAVGVAWAIAFGIAVIEHGWPWKR